MGRDFERRLEKIEAVIGKPEGAITLLAVHWEGDVERDPGCPGYEAKIAEAKQGGGKAVICWCGDPCKECFRHA